MRVLVTGMSGTGKSSVVRELRRRGFTAYDADDDGYAEPAAGGAWRWRTEAVSRLLAGFGEQELAFFAGCSEEQALFEWDLIVLLIAPEPVVLERLATRTTNSFGRSEAEREHVLADMREVEPLLRRSAGAVIETTAPLASVTDAVLAAAGAAGAGP